MIRTFLLMLLSAILISGCGGKPAVKPTSKPIPKPIPISQPSPATSKPATEQESSKKSGGYYLDDGPGNNPPADIDAIPDAQPKVEPLLARANMPYKALGQTYVPMTIAQPYKERGVASWYGRRYHGKKTSSGEIYDMYGMSAAHTTLPLPSYARVTNLANGRSVIVRINDRGPFKSNRLIDLSYAAAHKLRISNQGSGLVEVEAINAAQFNANNTDAKPNTATVFENPDTSASTTTNPDVAPTPAAPASSADYFIQIGAFKNPFNAKQLSKKIRGLSIERDKRIDEVYNDGLYRLKIGPYDSKQSAEPVAADIHRRLNIPTYITN